jgi:hypothetical protein
MACRLPTEKATAQTSFGGYWHVIEVLIGERKWQEWSESAQRRSRVAPLEHDFSRFELGLVLIPTLDGGILGKTWSMDPIFAICCQFRGASGLGDGNCSGLRSHCAAQRAEAMVWPRSTRSRRISYLCAWDVRLGNVRVAASTSIRSSAGGSAVLFSPIIPN